MVWYHISQYLLAGLYVRVLISRADLCVCQKTAPPAPGPRARAGPRHKKWLSRFGKTQHCTTNDLPMCRARAGDSHALLGTLRSNPEHIPSMFESRFFRFSASPWLACVQSAHLLHTSLKLTSGKGANGKFSPTPAAAITRFCACPCHPSVPCPLTPGPT